MKSYGPGQMVHSNADTLLPWRAEVVRQVRAQMVRGGPWPITGPVEVALTFRFLRPKSAPNRKWPDVRPDLDKLERAALDALSSRTGAGVINDDAQVVILRAEKQYGERPGMTLTLRALELPARAAS